MATAKYEFVLSLMFIMVGATLALVGATGLQDPVLALIVLPLGLGILGREVFG